MNNVDLGNDGKDKRRTTQLACAIAKKLGLDDQYIEACRVTGFLHDIGKIAVPAEIFSSLVGKHGCCESIGSEVFGFAWWAKGAPPDGWKTAGVGDG